MSWGYFSLFDFYCGFNSFNFPDLLVDFLYSFLNFTHYPNVSIG